LLGRDHREAVYVRNIDACSIRIDVAGPGDVETRKVTTTYTLGTGLQHQQVANVWSSSDTIVSLSFSGDLNVFDRRSGEKPVKVLHVCDNMTPIKFEIRVLLNHLGVCRVLRKPSPPLSRILQHPGRSSSGLPMVGCSPTILQEKRRR
jgi:hypothetical protein